MDILFGLLLVLFGLAVLIGIAWLFSVKRSAVDWQLVGTGVALQVGFAACVLLGSRWVAWVERSIGADPTTDVIATWLLIVVVIFVAGLVALLASMRTPSLRRAAFRAIGLAVLLALPFAGNIFEFLSQAFVKLLGFVGAGSNFIFGSLMDTSKFGFIFAFQVLPTIIFFAALMGVLYHLGVIQWIVSSEERRVG